LAAAAPFSPQSGPAAGAVFVETDGLAGNQVVAYQRGPSGALTEAGSFATGGLGGQLTGSVVDHTASQGALAFDSQADVLLAVNPGSNTISVFRVYGDHLALRQVLSSGGRFPVSVTTDGSQAYVLNAEEGGSIQGYVVLPEGVLVPIAGEHRELRLAQDRQRGEEEQFTHTPGEIAFTPDGRQLIVTTKAAGQSVLVYQSFPFGLSREATVNPEGVSVPFAVAFTPTGEPLVANAGASSLTSFQLTGDGDLVKIDEVGTGQAATCWVAEAAGFYFTSNAGSASVTGFALQPGGQLTDLGNTPSGAGTVDAAAAAGFLYVRGGAAGTITEYRVLAGGVLEQIGSLVVPGAAGGEGIVAL
jgi:DNA-binding beta-propeller fold protein YncE